MERLFVDTSAWFAYVNRDDSNHAAMQEVLRQHQGRLVTSNYVFDETVTLCRHRLGHAVAARVGAALLDPTSADLIRIGVEDEHAAWGLFVARADKLYSFTDCTSFVLMRRLGLGRSAALDDHFRQEGFSTLPKV